MNKPHKALLKKVFIITIIACLVVSALLGIAALLLGSFGETEGRILLSTLTVGVLSVTSLANLRNVESKFKSFRYFAVASIVFSLVAMLLTLSLIWLEFDSNNNPWRETLVFFILAFSTAHISLLLPSKAQSALLVYTVIATVACIVIVAGCLIYLVLDGSHVEESFFRTLGVFAILDVLGTIVTPLVPRLTKKSS